MTISSIEHKVALITGAGAGIGAEVARRLADAGAQLLLVDKDATALNSVRRQIGDHRAACLQIDVTDIAAVRDAIQGLPDAQRPDILVNAVGGDANLIPLAELDETYLETSMRHNLTSAFTMTRLCAPAMRQRGWGRIVNFASIAGRTYSYFSNAAYVAAKAAVIGFTKQTAYELAPDGVCVNAVAHGPIATDRIQAAWAKHSPERRQSITDRIPIGRLGTVEEAAAVVIHLCSQEAGYTTGTVIDINGGLFI
jgi:NAD(P)-dependent dehydrogenase (short-subunit alcohol dehydrogenase family)